MADATVSATSRVDVTTSNNISSLFLADATASATSRADATTSTNGELATSSKVRESFNVNNNYYLNVNDCKHVLRFCKYLSILTINIRSLNKNCDKISELITFMKFEPSVIIVSELWIKEGQSFLFNLPHYNFVSNKSYHRSGGAGIFIKEELEFKITEDFRMDTEACENVWITLSLNKKEKVLIGSIYRHPQTDFSLFENEFIRILEVLHERKMNYLIGGDFNIDLNKNNQRINNYTNMIKSCGSTQLVEKPTRYSSQASASLLDHLYTNLPDQRFHTNILLSDISDHLPVLTFYKSKVEIKLQRSYKRDFNLFDENKFLCSLESIASSLLTNDSLNTNDICNTFFSQYEELVNLHAPLKLRSKKQMKRKQKPWLTSEMLKVIKIKNSIFRKHLKTKSKNDRLKYIKKRNDVSRIVQRAKRTYYNNIFKSCKSNTKSLWKNINELISLKEKTPQSISEVLDDDGNQITTPIDISNTFNNFFTGIGENLSTFIAEPSAFYKRYFDSIIKPNKNSIYLTPITPMEISQIIKQISLRKSTPSSCASVYFLKLFSPYMCSFLSILFNRCLCDGVFPDSIKQAEVIPIFKSGNKSCKSNYRPISLLNPFSKILEKCIYTRLLNFLNSNRILYKNQFGFRKKCSTENAVLEIYDQISKDIDHNKINCSIFLDFKKAFDTVNHNVLLRKLERYGIRGNAFLILKSFFLQNRTQYTLVNGRKSCYKGITCGVPQGSTLGPLLFLIYINDLYQSTTLRINLFADDSYLSLANTSAKLLEAEVNNELETVNQWLRYNKVSLNKDKSSFIIFSKQTIHDMIISKLQWEIV